MVQKKRGRPTAFNRDEALEQALRVFWAKGYEGASLDDLTEAMNIGRPSLYNAFGDKKALFDETVARYASNYGKRTLDAFLGEETPQAAVEAFLKGLIETNTRNKEACGCFIATVVSSLASQEKALGKDLRNGLQSTEKTLAQKFEQFVEAEQLPDSFPVEARARLLMDMMHGLSYRARIGVPRKQLFAEVPGLVAAVLD